MNYNDKHKFEPSNETRQGVLLCECGLPLDIPTMHFVESQPTAEWEEEWDNLTNNHEFDYMNDGKVFIRKLLESQKQELISRIQTIINESTDTDGFGTTDYEIIGERVIELIKREKE